MNGKNSDKSSSFVPYDDENLEHVSAGPDYGQPWSSSNAWTEVRSKKYPEFVAEVMDKILSNKIRIDSSGAEIL
jgi:hypothetical protein